MSKSISWNNPDYQYELQGEYEVRLAGFERRDRDAITNHEYRYEVLWPEQPTPLKLFETLWKRCLRFPIFCAGIQLFNVAFGVLIVFLYAYYWIIVQICCCLPCSKRIYREKVRSGSWLWYICNVKVIPCCCIIRWLRYPNKSIIYFPKPWLYNPKTYILYIFYMLLDVC